MATRSPEQLRDDLVRLAHQGEGIREFSHGAARILSRNVPFEGFCLLTVDPATLLPTGEVVENGLPADQYVPMAEMAGEGVNVFRALAHCELRGANGFGDELRAVLSSDSRTWGALTLLRGADSGCFGPTDSATVAAVSEVLAEGVRRAMLLADPPAEHPDTSEPAGLALLAADNSLITVDAAAERWLAELQETGSGALLPPVVTAVAARARSVIAGRAEGDSPAKARVRTPSGRWLLVRASALGDEADAYLTVILEPAPAEEIAPLMADAYDLSERERAVTRLVARGLSTNAIAACLHISSYTVQDHLKAIFDKVGVSTRGELVARLFFEHDAPRLSDV